MDFNIPPKHALKPLTQKIASLLHSDFNVRKQFYFKFLIPSGHANFDLLMSEEYIEALQKDPKAFQALLKLIL